MAEKSLVPDDVAANARHTVAAYLRTFARRISANARVGNPPFKNPEASALLALAHVWLSDTKSTTGARGQALEALVSITRPLFEQVREHSAAIDIAGLAWSDAYGRLPIRMPPVEQVEWVLESGNQRSAVSGVMASAWRAAFLASVLSMLDWEHRPVARREGERWKVYLQSKLTGSSHLNGDSSAYSLNARLAFAIGLAAIRSGDSGLRAAAEDKLAAVNVDDVCSQRDASAAVIAQIGASQYLLGHAEVGNLCARHLLEHHRNNDTSLIETGQSETRRTEFSPWILLSLLPAQGA